MPFFKNGEILLLVEVLHFFLLLVEVDFEFWFWWKSVTGEREQQGQEQGTTNRSLHIESYPSGVFETAYDFS